MSAALWGVRGDKNLIYAVNKSRENAENATGGIQRGSLTLAAATIKRMTNVNYEQPTLPLEEITSREH